MSKLYLIPTPIGNLEDITLRAINLLKSVDFILAEDTRTTGKLLKHLEISNNLYPYHKFNEHKAVEGLIAKIQNAETVALVSDAGTPGISDPGYLLVKNCIDNEIEVDCIPGATAFVPALINSGFPNNKFCFEGFLPQKKGRQKALESLVDEKRAIIFYESPHRLLKTLTQLNEYFGEARNVSVSREITKMHEETVRGTLKEVLEIFSSRASIKGELVIVLEGESKK